MSNLITWKQNLRKLSKEDNSMLRDYCRLSKNVYNSALYSIRQHFFATGEYLRYESNFHVMKTDENYQLLGGGQSQQTMRCVDDAMKSFFKLNKMKREGKLSVTKVGLPHYLPQDGYYPVRITVPTIKDGYFYLPISREMRKKTNHKVIIRIPDKLIDKDIHQIHIVPMCNGKFFEIRYIFEGDSIEKATSLDSSKFLGIDLGINNFATCVTTEGKSFILCGRRLKSLNQWYNKYISKLQSINDVQNRKKNHNPKRTNRMNRVTRRRNNQIHDFMYKSAKYIVDYCKANNIGNLVIGYNEEFQQAPNMGKRNNQTFVQIPFGQFKNRLKFLAERYGIKITMQEESYTSKSSFFDNDLLPTYGQEKMQTYSFSGKRVSRGLYKTSNGYKFNADLNGALNILRKSNLADLTVLQARGYVMKPSRIRIL